MEYDREEEPRDIVTVAHLFDPSTGIRVAVRETFKDYTELAADFMWTEGNYSCDCNRRSFLLRAIGELGPYEFPEPNPCGDSIVLEKLEFVE
jgi:hypothetical protein